MARYQDPSWELVRGHDKPAFGFWQPDRLLSPEEVDRAAAELRDLRGDMADWNRCQGLARLARQVASPELRADLLREAFANAYRQREPNPVVTVASWPLRMLLETGELEWFARELDHLLTVIATEPNPVRRQDGLYALLFVDAPRACFEKVLRLYSEACAGPQKTLTMRRVAAYVNRVDHAKALEVCLLIREPRRRRQALRSIGEAEAHIIEGA